MTLRPSDSAKTAKLILKRAYVYDPQNIILEKITAIQAALQIDAMELSLTTIHEAL